MPKRSELLVGACLLGVMFFCALMFLFRFSPSLPEGSPSYERLAYDDLPGWENDHHGEAFGAFLESCKKLSPAIWRDSCAQAQKLTPVTDDRARGFFEEFFTPLSFRDETEGLFTGYFAPEYAGSRTRRDAYQTPLYLVPDDLQVLDLGNFDRGLKGKRIIGEVQGGQFVPYKDRKNIDQGALVGRGLELVWLKNPEDAFFLHIQGSGRILFEDGQAMQVAYGGKNGRPYRAIGKYLIKEGAVAAKDMSLQAIVSWMEENPDRVRDLMWKNPSYVFFRERTEPGVVGTLGVPLTAGRSLAVDRRHIPLGVPLWLDVHSDPETKMPGKIPRTIQRLVMAQDTGGAIRGAVRGDLFWGTGEKAGLKAGPMKDRGTYYLLLPHVLADRYVGGGSLVKRRPLKPEEERLWKHVTRDITTLGQTTTLPPVHYGTPHAQPTIRRPHINPVPPVFSQAVEQHPDHNWHKKLRRGRARPEGKLDLHGMTRQQAFQTLHRYIDTARARGKRVVLVVTGKGGGILKREVPMWLSEGELGRQIVSFYTAGSADGGEGALYVVLKKTP